MLIVMALTPSTMAALGTQAPTFSLPDIVTGKIVSLDDVMGDKGVLVMFICGHCPFVVHVQSELARLGRDYQNSGIGIAAICSNDEGVSPRDSLANLKARPSNDIRVDGRDLRVAMDALIAGKAVSEDQTPAVGCNIKWRDS